MVTQRRRPNGHIDFDSYDLWTFRAVVGSPYRPRVISVEYNALFPFDSTLTLRFPVSDGFWNRKGATAVFGSSLGALDMVASEGGYTLVYIVSGLDAFFVRNDILLANPLLRVTPLSGLAPVANRIVDGPCRSNSNTTRWPSHRHRRSLGGRPSPGLLGIRCRQMPMDTTKLLALEDYLTYSTTGSHVAARDAAMQSKLVAQMLNGRPLPRLQAASRPGPTRTANLWRRLRSALG